MSFSHWIQAFLGVLEEARGASYPGIVLRVREGSVLFGTFSEVPKPIGLPTGPRGLGREGTLRWGKSQTKHQVTSIQHVKDHGLGTTLTVLECQMPSLTTDTLYATRKNEQLATALLFDHEDRLSEALQEIKFPYEALMNVPAQVDTSTSFLGRTLSSPIYVVGMTGGSEETHALNQLLAQAAQRAGIGMAVGSQRWVLEQNREMPLRKSLGISDEVPLIGNLGIAEVLTHGVSALKRLQQLTGVDAVAIHLNIFQELLQREGQRTFVDTFARLHDGIAESPIPVILKETGCGFSAPLLEQLVSWNLAAIELTSTAGTQWSALEGLRHEAGGARRLSAEFSEVGHDAQSQLCLIQQFSQAPKRKPKLVASGGITQGIQVAKLIYAGADLCSLGRGVLRVLHEQDGRSEALDSYFRYIQDSLRLAMTLTQTQTLDRFRGLWRPSN